MVNPAAEASRTRLIEQYTFQLIQRVAQYRPYLKEQNVQGSVIVRLVLSIDGRLIDASISRSSGLPDLDKALMESVRAASPYPPIPPGLGSGQGTFLLPLGFRPN